MAETIDRLRTALADRYEVSKEIGQGGMATVFLGHDLKHDRDVAIKVLHPDLGAALGSERFLSEIKTTAKLQHPHILPLLDSGSADSLLYYVMPFVVGESLRARIDRERQLPMGDAVRITQEVANALDYAHRQGVIHRDIKPENILIHDRQALVADFGIALAVSAAGGGRLTQTGLSLGTPQYMSPEQAVGERTIDARSDIYSLGAVTYEMITGDPPFAGSSVQAVVAKIMTERPTPISRLRETVPENVEDAVMIALAKLPADRFATAAEFAAALTSTTGRLTSARNTQRTPGRRRIDIIAQRAFIPAVAVALVMSLLALRGWMRHEPPRQVVRNVVPFDSAQALSGGWNRIALSPDGSTLVFRGGAKSSLFVRRRDQLTATEIPGTEGAISPFFSPDGNQVGFSTFGFTLKTVSLQGGSPTIITDSLVSRAGSDWGRDGMVYLPDRNNDAILRIAPSPGAVATPVSTLDTAAGEINQRMPEALPNGKGILFTVYYNGKGKNGTAIAAGDIATRTHTILVAGTCAKYSTSGHLLYVTDAGTLMAAPFDEDKMRFTGEAVAIADGLRLGNVGACDLALSRYGTLAYVAGAQVTESSLLWVSRTGVATQVDPNWRAFFMYPALSPDNRRLAVTIASKNNVDIWVKQLPTGPSLKLTFEGTNNTYPTWTPDGRFVTYYSNANPSRAGEDLWTKRADGSAQAVRQLTDRRPLAESEWSADGKWLIYRTSINVAGAGDIFAIRPGVDTVPIPIAATPFAELSPTLSPDGRWIAYASNESGRSEVFVVPFPDASKAKWPVSTQGGSEPLWSRSGGEIFYRDAAGFLVAVQVKTSPTFSLGVAKPLFDASAYEAIGARRQYDVSRDDSHFLMIGNNDGRAPDKLIVVDNWFEELKAKFKK